MTARTPASSAPNTIGVANSFDYFHTSFQKFDLYNKANALVCQSGMFVLGSADFTSGLGIGIDIGNGADVEFADLLEHLAADERIEVINLHMEGVSNGVEFVELASQITPSKPIVAFKVGQSEEGAKAAASHSGALSSADHVVNAAFDKAGVMRVGSVEEMRDLNKALLTYPEMKGKRFAVITISGGGRDHGRRRTLRAGSRDRSTFSQRDGGDPNTQSALDARG